MLIRASPNPRARLLFLVEWRQGSGSPRRWRSRPGTCRWTPNGPPSVCGRVRIVPVHAELYGAPTIALQFGNVG